MRGAMMLLGIFSFVMGGGVLLGAFFAQQPALRSEVPPPADKESIDKEPIVIPRKEVAAEIDPTPEVLPPPPPRKARPVRRSIRPEPLPADPSMVDARLARLSAIIREGTPITLPELQNLERRFLALRAEATIARDREACEQLLEKIDELESDVHAARNVR